MGAASDLLIPDLAEGEQAARKRAEKQQAEDDFQKRVGALNTKLPIVEYPTAKGSGFRLSASAILSGGTPKLKGAKIEYKKEW